MSNDPQAGLESPEAKDKALRWTGVALVLLAAGVIAANYRWLMNVVNGPVQLTQAQLSKVAKPGDLDNQWVKFVSPKALDFGVTLSRRRDRTTKFLLVSVEDRFLIARVPEDFNGKEYSGYVEVWGSSSPFDGEVKKLQALAPPEVREKLLPFHLDAAYDQSTQCYGVMGLMAFLLLAGLFLASGAMSSGEQPAGSAAKRNRLPAT